MPSGVRPERIWRQIIQNLPSSIIIHLIHSKGVNYPIVLRSLILLLINAYSFFLFLTDGLLFLVDDD